MTRLERFRRFVQAMDPTAPAVGAGGPYVEPPSNVAQAVTSKLELTPTQRVLVVGCAGSGKSSLVQRCVEKIGDSVGSAGEHAAYLDVSKHHRLDAENLAGVLIAIAGEHLADMLTDEVRQAGPVKAAQSALRRHARGYFEWVTHEPDYDDEAPYDDEPDGHNVHQPGVLQPPSNPLIPWRFNQLVGPLRVLREAAIGIDKPAILAFDSLDRLGDAKRFSEAVKDDLPALAAARIGSIVVGPVRYALSSDRSIHDLFDDVQIVKTWNTHTDRSFLMDVLRRRDPQDLLGAELAQSLVTASGGVLRDLIQLARRAGEDAYAAGRDPVGAADGESATDALGDSLAFGIDDADLRVLRSLDEDGKFVIRGDRELALIDQRRVLSVGTGSWAIHPALLPKLRSIPKEAA